MINWLLGFKWARPNLTRQLNTDLYVTGRNLAQAEEELERAKANVLFLKARHARLTKKLAKASDNVTPINKRRAA